MSKLYCFVDETGQDTLGKFFLVAVVLKSSVDLEKLTIAVEKAERTSGKNLKKWMKCPLERRIAFLDLISELKELRGAIYYSTYLNSINYLPLVAMTVAKSIIAQKEDKYQARIIIDGLKETETLFVKKELKKLNIHYKNVRGMKDEQNSMLRLADTFAGFIRDYIEGEEFTKNLMKKFLANKVINEV